MLRWINRRHGQSNLWIWLTAGCVSLCLLATMGLMLLVAQKGLRHFWPMPVYQMEVNLTDGTTRTLMGERLEVESVPVSRISFDGLDPGHEPMVERWLMKTGAQQGRDPGYYWVLPSQIREISMPLDILTIERRSQDSFYGRLVGLVSAGQDVPLDQLDFRLLRAQHLAQELTDLRNSRLTSLNYELNELRLKLRRGQLGENLNSMERLRLEQMRQSLQVEYQKLEKEAQQIQLSLIRDHIRVQDSQGKELAIPLSDIIRMSLPNTLGLTDKLMLWGSNLKDFIVTEPRHANTMGGIYPAIFGTVFMVLLMSVLVMPLGVIAAIYLNEYAYQGMITRYIRIAVINLAGVPSIVYGVFGLGFFVYSIGGSLDQLFYPEALPTPTFGTPGILWSSLTMALLTLPVVIVATEEGLRQIPDGLRHGSLALGATKAETLWRLLLPIASPAMMTGLILAIARAAGEVAPLMLVGVVKVAPTLPLDTHFPYVHLERKFMHLGYHIYDVAYQSPNIEASRSLVYATTMLLVTVVVGLNLIVFSIRSMLRDKYSHSQMGR